MKGKANWKRVNQIKKRCKVPLIINGDILDSRSAKKAIKDSQCDGIMIGRGLMGRPWLINDLANSVFQISSKNEQKECIVAVISEHIEAIYSFYGHKIGNLKARKHLNWYLKNFLISPEIRKDILKCTTLGSLNKFLKRLNEFPILNI